VAPQPIVLQPLGRALVRSASPAPIEAAAASLATYMEGNRWLGANNRYLKETVQRLREDLDAGGQLSPINQKHLRELIAASAVTHCIDGWALLGRAVSSTLLGDPHSARHLAYYAELRGASSVLARSGIAVLNAQHLVVDALGTVNPVRRAWISGGGGTHVAAWLFLQEWSASPDAAALTSSILVPEGIPLSEWFTGTPAWALWRMSASTWLRELGVDVRLMARDQYARNEASYRPNTLRADRVLLSATDTSRFVTELWAMAEPGTRPFEALDGHVLRVAVERAYRRAKGAAADLAVPQYRAEVETLVVHHGLEGAHRDRVASFLTRDTHVADPLLLQAAGTASKAINAGHHLHAMARAALMLRVATGAARQMLQNAAIESDLLEFWWQELASSRSICNAVYPQELLDVWADVTDAIQQVEEYLTGGGDVTFVGLGHPERSAVLHTLAKLELAGLVGLLT